MLTPTKRTAHSIYNLNYPSVLGRTRLRRIPQIDYSPVDFVVRYRHEVLTDGVDDFVKQQIQDICTRYGWEQLALEVMPDHEISGAEASDFGCPKGFLIPLFVSAPPMIAPNTIARTIKSITAIAIFKAYPALKQKRFWRGSFWSDGCYYGSAGTVSAATIAKYIANQKSKPE
jgi:putative transposase